MRDSPGYRFGVLLLFGILAGLLVFAGTIEQDSSDNNVPENDNILETPGAYTGERVSVWGTIVDTDPLTIEDEPRPGDSITFVVETVETDVEPGEHLSVYGTLHEDNRIEVNSVVHREPWEIHYEWLTPQYVTSAMAGAIVPDLSRLDLVVPGTIVESLLGIPFDWWGSHTLGGGLVVAIATLCTTSEHRRRGCSSAVTGGPRSSPRSLPWRPGTGATAGIRHNGDPPCVLAVSRRFVRDPHATFSSPFHSAELSWGS